MSDAAIATDTGSPKIEKSCEGRGFLEERPGHKSAIRTLSFIAPVAAIRFGAFSLIQSDVGNRG